jgi:hypothetical protein
VMHPVARVGVVTGVAIVRVVVLVRIVVRAHDRLPFLMPRADEYSLDRRRRRRPCSLITFLSANRYPGVG